MFSLCYWHNCAVWHHTGQYQSKLNFVFSCFFPADVNCSSIIFLQSQILLPEIIFFLFLNSYQEEFPIQPGQSSVPLAWLVAQWWLLAPGLLRGGSPKLISSHGPLDSPKQMQMSSLRSLKFALLKSKMTILGTVISHYSKDFELN